MPQPNREDVEPYVQRPDLSVVTTLYNSEKFLAEFYSRITAAARKITSSYELVFVNDGSPDDSLQRALGLADADCHVKVVDLSRNFGHHAAILAGLRYARGNVVFLIDVDLEEQPEWLIDFWEDLHRAGADTVFGVQSSRSGTLVKRLTGNLFYAMFNHASDTPIPSNTCTVRLMRRSYVEAVTQFTESHLFLAGLFSWAGFSQHSRDVIKTSRPGKSNYTPVRLARLFVTAVTSFSSYPLTVVFLIGVCLTIAALLIGAKLLITKLLWPDTIVSGFASIMISLWFIGGAVISILGLLGLYVGRIFVESKSRPQYVVRRVHERHL